MKAKLLLEVEQIESLNGDQESGVFFLETSCVLLYLVLADKRKYTIIKKFLNSDEESLLDMLEDCVNEAGLIINSIPGIKLQIDDSVYDFFVKEFNKDENELRKFINQLIIEI